ncbi:hypothetical protein [Psychrilyobacter atlanticus]|uniref:hypothetical protein n=1 Tax=Psychrilyobacter atlanticus TaxID=271091 RepID=UPI00146AEA11|nr:hypothetical protein [Psychrilyobacter atlanticus]
MSSIEIEVNNLEQLLQNKEIKKCLISLNTEAFNDFINGDKKFEYRRKYIDGKTLAFIYVTSPIKQLRAAILFDKPILDTPEEIAKIAESEHPHWKEGALEYLKGCKKGYAIPAKKLFILKPIDLIGLGKIGITPPQSYVYLINEKRKLFDEIEIQQNIDVS